MTLDDAVDVVVMDGGAHVTGSALTQTLRDSLKQRQVNGYVPLSFGKADHGKLGHGDTQVFSFFPLLFFAGIVKILYLLATGCSFLLYRYLLSDLSFVSDA